MSRAARIRLLLVAAGLSLWTVQAHAVCNPDYSFADYGYNPSTYTYVHFGPDAIQSSDAIVGRFWEAGMHEGGSEGSYDDSQWMTLEGPDKWDFQGFQGSYGVAGCVRHEMILTLQDTTQDGTNAVFTVGRVSFDGALEHVFPFWLTGTDWHAISFPSACRMHERHHRDTVDVQLALDDVQDGFHGEAGMLAADTITGYTIWTAHATSDPGRSTVHWTLAATVPYDGPGTTAGLEVTCDPGSDVYVAVGVEFDHGQSSSDFVGKTTRIVCDRHALDPDDLDGDGTEDRCDNCPDAWNPSQVDYDGNGHGDACDPPPTQLRHYTVPTTVKASW